MSCRITPSISLPVSGEISFLMKSFKSATDLILLKDLMVKLGPRSLIIDSTFSRRSVKERDEIFSPSISGESKI